MNSRFLFALKNYREAIAAAFFFGCIAPGAKFLVADIPAQSLAGVLYLAAGLGLFGLLVFRNELKSAISQFQSKDTKWLVGAIFFGGILGPAFLTSGLSHISGSTASLLLNLEAVLTALIAWIVFKEHFEIRILWGMLAIVAGCLVLSWPLQASEGQDSWTGFLLVASACLAWGIDNNVTRNISHLNPLFSASAKGLIAGSTNLFLGFLIGEKLELNFSLLSASLLGFFGIGISLVAFIVSLSKIGTARTGALFSTAPFIGSILSIAVLKESISIPFLISLALMGLGVWLHLSEDHGHVHEHLPLEHNHEHIHDEHHQHEHDSGTDPSEPHSHNHRHTTMTHSHPHFPDIHHQHSH